MKFTWSTFRKAESAKTIGHQIVVDLPLLGIQSVPAKVDTGAFTGALHVTNVRELHNKKGETCLRFSPLGSKNHTIQVNTYHKRKVKSSNGQVSARYTIDTSVEILGETYPITITLTNRKHMKYPMLIGRNLLRIHGFLIDLNHQSE